MKRRLYCFSGIGLIILLMVILSSCHRVKFEQIQMDINDLQNQLVVSKKRQDQMGMLIEQVHSEFIVVSEQTGQVESRVKTVENLQDSLHRQIQELQSLEMQLIRDSGKPPIYLPDEVSDKSAEAKESKSVSPPSLKGLDHKNLYKQSLAELNKGRISSAIKGFQEYLERFPSTTLSDNAQYWLGECFYQQRKYDLAIQHFQRVIDNFPQGNKVPAAMLKLGYSYFQLGKYQESLTNLKSVIEKYPEREEPFLARKMADKIMIIINNKK